MVAFALPVVIVPCNWLKAQIRTKMPFSRRALVGESYTVPAIFQEREQSATYSTGRPRVKSYTGIGVFVALTVGLTVGTLVGARVGTTRVGRSARAVPPMATESAMIQPNRLASGY